MKIEIYQIGKVPPLTVVECDKWVVDFGKIPSVRMIKDDTIVAHFFANNIAGFKVISEDDEERSENNG